jgi:hypothetical protein
MAWGADMDNQFSSGREPEPGRGANLRRRLGSPQLIAAMIVALAAIIAAVVVLVTISSRGPHSSPSAARAPARATPEPVTNTAPQATPSPTVSATPASPASPTASPTATATPSPTPQQGTTPPPAPAPGQVVHDNTGDISVLIPDSWTSVEGDGWHPSGLPPFANGTDIGPGVNASTNVPAWFTNLTTPGLFVGASRQLPTDGYTPATLLQHIGFTGCGPFSSQPYAIGPWTGTLDTQTCANSPTRLWNIAMWPRDHSYIICVQIKIVTKADQAAGDRALASLSVNY